MILEFATFMKSNENLFQGCLSNSFLETIWTGVDVQQLIDGIQLDSNNCIAHSKKASILNVCRSYFSYWLHSFNDAAAWSCAIYCSLFFFRALVVVEALAIIGRYVWILSNE